MLCASRFAGCSAVRGFVLRALPMARWDVWDAYDAWDDGFLKLAFGASRRIWPHHLQGASRMNQNRRIQCNRQGAFAQDLAKHLQGASRIEFLEMIKASFMREALRHLPLENQMSHASHASHTSHPQAESKARSTPHPPPTNNTKTNKKGNET